MPKRARDELEIEDLVESLSSMTTFGSQEEYDLLMEGFLAAKPSEEILEKAMKRYKRYMACLNWGGYEYIGFQIDVFVRFFSSLINDGKYEKAFILMKNIDRSIVKVLNKDHKFQELPNSKKVKC